MLKKGQRFTLAGIRYRVTSVSVCRALCIGEERTFIVRTTRDGATSRYPVKRVHTINISPDTPLDLLAEFESGRRSPVFPKGC